MIGVSFCWWRFTAAVLIALTASACGYIGSREVTPFDLAGAYLGTGQSYSGASSGGESKLPPKSCPDGENLPCIKAAYHDIAFAPDSGSVFVTYRKDGARSNMAARVDLTSFSLPFVEHPVCGVAIDRIALSRSGVVAMGVGQLPGISLPPTAPRFTPGGLAVVPSPGAAPWLFNANRRVSHIALSGDGRILFAVLVRESGSLNSYSVQGFDPVNGVPIHAITRQPSNIAVNEFQLLQMSQVHRIWSDETGGKLLMLAQVGNVTESMFDPIREGLNRDGIAPATLRFLFEIDMRSGQVRLHDLNKAVALEPGWPANGASLNDFGVAANGDILFTLIQDAAKDGAVTVRRYRAGRVDVFANTVLPLTSGTAGWLQRFAISPDERRLAFQYKAPPTESTDEVFAILDRSSGVVRPVDVARTPYYSELAKPVCRSS